ncbi:Mss4-like protein [Cyathus striatus]|nr:Mss4-like protein [Cyathus striatus]
MTSQNPVIFLSSSKSCKRYIISLYFVPLFYLVLRSPLPEILPYALVYHHHCIPFSSPQAIRYEVALNSPDEARTSICYCSNCKKWTGSAFGITTKIPKSSFKITKGKTTEHVSDNGSGTQLHREFCITCGGGIWNMESAGDNIYITYGSLDNTEELPPKGEFFCKYKEQWIPEIPRSTE